MSDRFKRFVTTDYKDMKGRTFLILAGLFALWLLLTYGLFALTTNWANGIADEKSAIISAVDVTGAKDFKWQMNTEVGHILAQGAVTTPRDQCQRFSEMSRAAQCSPRIERIEETYTKHMQTYECGTSKNPRTCTRTYWTWDQTNQWDKQADHLKLLNYQLPYGFLKTDMHEVNPSVLGIGGCDGTYCYQQDDNDVRYSYYASPSTYQGVAFLDSEATGVRAFRGFERNGTITTIRADAQKPAIAPAVVFWLVEMLLTVGFLVVDSLIAGNDIDDGEDDEF